MPCTLRTFSHAFCNYVHLLSCGGFGPNGLPPADSKVPAQLSRDSPPLPMMAEVAARLASALDVNMVSAEQGPVEGGDGNCGKHIKETHGEDADAGMHDAASASASGCSASESGVQVLSNLLARGESEFDEEIASLKKHRADMKQEHN